jgi:hypothetical protein
LLDSCLAVKIEWLTSPRYNLAVQRVQPAKRRISGQPEWRANLSY